jgi:hypothetical protein
MQAGSVSTVKDIGTGVTLSAQSNAHAEGAFVHVHT